MFRDYRAVARSNVAFFPTGTSHRDLAPMLAGDQANWRCERLGDEARALVASLYRPDLSAHDAAALFWYARNSLLFERGLAADPRVRLCRYDELLAEPAGIMRGVYAFVERPWPGKRIVADVEPAPAHAPRPLDLEPDIARACNDLLARLEAAPRIAPPAAG
jgi:hypothetical protein